MDSSKSGNASGAPSQATRVTPRPVSIPLSTQVPSHNEQATIPTTSATILPITPRNFSRPLSGPRFTAGKQNTVSKVPSHIQRRSGDHSHPQSFVTSAPTENVAATAGDVTSSPSESSGRPSTEQQPQPPHYRDSGVLPEAERTRLIRVISNEGTGDGKGLGPVERPGIGQWF
jgi:hypothetical protein